LALDMANRTETWEVLALRVNLLAAADERTERMQSSTADRRSTSTLSSSDADVDVFPTPACATELQAIEGQPMIALQQRIDCLWLQDLAINHHAELLRVLVDSINKHAMEGNLSTACVHDLIAQLSEVEQMMLESVRVRFKARDATVLDGGIELVTRTVEDNHKRFLREFEPLLHQIDDGTHVYSILAELKLRQNKLEECYESLAMVREVNMDTYMDVAENLKQLVEFDQAFNATAISMARSNPSSAKVLRMALHACWRAVRSKRATPVVVGFILDLLTEATISLDAVNVTDSLCILKILCLENPKPFFPEVTLLSISQKMIESDLAPPAHSAGLVVLASQTACYDVLWSDEAVASFTQLARRVTIDSYTEQERDIVDQFLQRFSLGRQPTN
jgi:hypothetical protein